MKRMLRRLCRIVFVAAFVVALVMALVPVFGPAVVEQELTDALRGRGLTGATLDVRSVDWRHAHLSGVRLGEGTAADRVEIAYSPKTLLNGRVGTITVVGARWRIAVTEDGLDLGALGQWRSGAGAGDAPWGRIDLRASTLLLKRRGRPTRLPVAGRLTKTPSNRWRFELTAEYAGRPWRITGECPADARSAEFTLHVGGRPLAEVAYQRQQSGHRLAVSGDIAPPGGKLWGHTAAIEGGRFEGALSLDENGQPSDGELAFRASSVSLAGQAVAGPRLVIAQTGPRRAAWRLRAGNRDEPLATGSCEWTGDAFQIEAEPIDVAPGGTIAALLENATGLVFSGSAGLSGRLAWSGRGLEPRLTTTLDDATVRGPEGRYHVSGLRAAVTFNEWSPPSTEGGQRLRWEKATLGRFDVGPGAARFTLESPRSLLIEHLTWRMWDGRLRMMGVRFDPAAPAFSANVFGEDLALDPLLDTATVGRARGTGRVFGRLALRIRAEPRFRVALGDSFLQAVGPGTLSVPDAGLVSGLLADRGHMAEGTGYREVVRRRIAESLKDFRYDTLRFIVRTDREPPVLRVDLAGEGGEHDQPIDLAVNLTGFQNFMDAALRFKAGMDRSADPAWLKRPADTQPEGD